MSKSLWFRMLEQARLRNVGCYTMGANLQDRGIYRYRLHMTNIEARFGVGCIAGLRGRP